MLIGMCQSRFLRVGNLFRQFGICFSIPCAFCILWCRLLSPSEITQPMLGSATSREKAAIADFRASCNLIFGALVMSQVTKSAQFSASCTPLVLAWDVICTFCNLLWPIRFLLAAPQKSADAPRAKTVVARCFWLLKSVISGSWAPEI